MMEKRFVLYRPGGKQVSSYSFGKLVERRYIDLVPSEIASPDLDTFLASLRKTRDKTDETNFRRFRVGHVDENGAGLYYDAREFLKCEGRMDGYSEPEPLSEAVN